MIKNITDNNGNILAIVVFNEPKKDGINFFTSDENNLQVAQGFYPSGRVVDAHTHNDIVRNVVGTQEVVIMKKGKYRVDFYDNDKNYIISHLLVEGEVIIFIQGSHGFKSIEDVELIEIKQGPFVEGQDKIKFTGIKDSEVRYHI